MQEQQTVNREGDQYGWQRLSQHQRSGVLAGGDPRVE